MLNPRRIVMTVLKRIRLVGFSFLLFISVVLSSMFIHEIGHGFGAYFSAVVNSTPGFGATGIYDKDLIISFNKYKNELKQEAKATKEEQLSALYLSAKDHPFLFNTVIGGWVFQVLVALLTLALLAWPAYRQTGSGFSRIFMASFVYFNFTWVAAILILAVFFKGTSTDSLVLQANYVDGSVLAKLVILFVAILLIAIAYLIVKYLGKESFIDFGISSNTSQQLALLWTSLSLYAGLSLAFPGSYDILITMVLFAVLPAYLLLKSKPKEGIKTSARSWFNLVAILSVIFIAVFTSSGFIIGKDSDLLSRQAVSNFYCDETNCLPEELKILFDEE